MPNDRQKNKTNFSYSSKDSNTELADLLDWLKKQFFNFFVLSKQMTAPPKEGTIDRQSSRDFFYKALAETSRFALAIALLILTFLLFFSLAEGSGIFLVILGSGILTSIIFYFFLSIASIGFSLREVEDQVTTQNTLQEKQIRLIERQLEIQQRLLEIQLEMLEDSQKDSEIDF